MESLDVWLTVQIFKATDSQHSVVVLQWDVEVTWAQSAVLHAEDSSHNGCAVVCLPALSPVVHVDRQEGLVSWTIRRTALFELQK